MKDEEQNKPEIEVKTITITRTGFLYRLVHEIISDVAGDNFLNVQMKRILHTGIEELKCIGEIILFMVRDGVRVGQIEISIDWDRHQVNIKNCGENVTLKDTGEFTEQVSGALADLVQMFGKLAELDGVECHLVFRYRPGVNKEEYDRKLNTKNVMLPLEHADMDDILDHLRKKEAAGRGNGKREPLESFDDTDSIFEMEVCPEALDELRVSAKLVRGLNGSGN